MVFRAKFQSRCSRCDWRTVSRVSISRRPGNRLDAWVEKCKTVMFSQ